MTLKCIYISGLYTAPPSGEYADSSPMVRQRNINTAWEAATRVWGLKGSYAFCPHTNTMHMDGAAGKDDYEKFLTADIDIIHRLADAILMLPNWERSRGAVRERDAAIEKGIPVFDLTEKMEWFRIEAWLYREQAKSARAATGAAGGK